MEIQEVIERRKLNFGEELMGIDIDSPEDTEVYKVKLIFAELAEKVKNNYEENRSPVKSLLFDHAIGELLNAQMVVVKLITFKS